MNKIKLLKSCFKIFIHIFKIITVIHDYTFGCAYYETLYIYTMNLNASYPRTFSHHERIRIIV